MREDIRAVGFPGGFANDAYVSHIIVMHEMRCNAVKKDHNDRKCAFGVFLDIIDSFQETNRETTSRRQTLRANQTICPFCSKEIESGAKACRYCGKEQSD